MGVHDELAEMSSIVGRRQGQAGRTALTVAFQDQPHGLGGAASPWPGPRPRRGRAPRRRRGRAAAAEPRSQRGSLSPRWASAIERACCASWVRPGASDRVRDVRRRCAWWRPGRRYARRPRSVRRGAWPARMGGDDLGAVEHPHAGQVGDHYECAPHAGVRHRVVVAVESDVGGLANLDQQALVDGKLVGRQGPRAPGVPAQTPRPPTVSGSSGQRRSAASPEHHCAASALRLVEIGDGASGEESPAHVLNSPFDPPLLVAPGRRRPAGVRSHNGWRAPAALRMQAHRGNRAARARRPALEVVVEQDSWTALPGEQGRLMAAQEVLHAGVDEKAQEDLTRPAQHHDETEQRPQQRHRSRSLPEARPVHLALLAGQRAQPEVGFGRPSWPIQRHQVTEMIRTADVATLPHQHPGEAAPRVSNGYSASVAWMNGT